MKLIKEYDFRTLKNLDEFTTKYMWEREKIINSEEQYYIDPDEYPENTPFALSENGLRITASLTPDDKLAALKSQPYLSGVLTTRDKGHSQLFGYWEASMKLPAARGAWPAFWLLPTTKEWGPHGVRSELDIMEGFKSSDVIAGKYSANCHTWQTGDLVQLKAEQRDIETGVDLTADYHTYALRWDEDHIVWLFDGAEVLRITTPTDMLDEPRHVLLNLAVGGAESWREQPVADDYPAALDIEYVRIYELPEKEKKDTDTDTDTKLPGDHLLTMKDGTFYTKRDINRFAEFLIQSNSLEKIKR